MKNKLKNQGIILQAKRPHFRIWMRFFSCLIIFTFFCQMTHLEYLLAEGEEASDGSGKGWDTGDSEESNDGNGSDSDEMGDMPLDYSPEGPNAVYNDGYFDGPESGDYWGTDDAAEELFDYQTGGVEYTKDAEDTKSLAADYVDDGGVGENNAPEMVPGADIDLGEDVPVNQSAAVDPGYSEYEDMGQTPPSDNPTELYFNEIDDTYQAPPQETSEAPATEELWNMGEEGDDLEVSGGLPPEIPVDEDNFNSWADELVSDIYSSEEPNFVTGPQDLDTDTTAGQVVVVDENPYGDDPGEGDQTSPDIRTAETQPTALDLAGIGEEGDRLEQGLPEETYTEAFAAQAVAAPVGENLDGGIPVLEGDTTVSDTGEGEIPEDPGYASKSQSNSQVSSLPPLAVDRTLTLDSSEAEKLMSQPQVEEAFTKYEDYYNQTASIDPLQENNQNTDPYTDDYANANKFSLAESSAMTQGKEDQSILNLFTFVSKTQTQEPVSEDQAAKESLASARQDLERQFGALQNSLDNVLGGNLRSAAAAADANGASSQNPFNRGYFGPGKEMEDAYQAEAERSQRKLDDCQNLRSQAHVALQESYNSTLPMEQRQAALQKANSILETAREIAVSSDGGIDYAKLNASFQSLDTGLGYAERTLKGIDTAMDIGTGFVPGGGLVYDIARQGTGALVGEKTFTQAGGKIAAGSVASLIPGGRTATTTMGVVGKTIGRSLLESAAANSINAVAGNQTWTEAAAGTVQGAVIGSALKGGATGISRTLGAKAGPTIKALDVDDGLAASASKTVMSRQPDIMVRQPGYPEPPPPPPRRPISSPIPAASAGETAPSSLPEAPLIPKPTPSVVAQARTPPTESLFDRFNKAKESSPPLEENKVRLYRAEKIPTNETAPSWMANRPEYRAQQEAAGRWFGADDENVRWYAKEYEGMGRVTYVDVPKDVVESYRVSNLPSDHSARRFSKRPDEEFFLPRDIADSKIEITR